MICSFFTKIILPNKLCAGCCGQTQRWTATRYRSVCWLKHCAALRRSAVHGESRPARQRWVYGSALHCRSPPGCTPHQSAAGTAAPFRQETCPIVRDQYLETHPHPAVRRGQRWLVKGKRPDGSTGRWDPDVRNLVVGYLWWRDDRRCGLCALPIARSDAQIEHVVPKKFGLFDLHRTRRGQRAVAGRDWRSRLHHPDNLQVAHAYCNRPKGNTPDTSKWRHPELRPLPVAENTVGAGYLWLPRRAGTGHLNEGSLPDRRDTPRTSHSRTTDRPPRARSAVSSSARQSDDELLRTLKAWRTATSRADGKPAYTVLTDRTLNELVSSRPQRKEDLARVHGIGPAKLDSYGQEILDLVAGRY